MRASVERGLRSTQTLLPGSLKLPRRAHTTFLRAQSLQSPQRDLALLSAFALAVAEENANGGHHCHRPLLRTGGRGARACSTISRP
jgi:L-serine dehydratase